MKTQKRVDKGGTLSSQENKTWHVFRLALPIIGGMASQNILNLVDTAMVGKLGDDALAGVGVASFASFTCMAFLMGLSSSVQAIASRRIGEGKQQETAFPLNGGLFLSLLIGIPLSILLFYLIPYFFPYLNKNKDVIQNGVPYLQARILCMAAVGMNFSFRGYWNAIEKPSLYMFTLILMHITNICLDYVLIFGKFGFPEYGAAGAGIATSIASFVGVICYIVLGFLYARPHGFFKKLPSAFTLRSLIKLSLPAGLQQLLFAAGMLVFFIILGQVGKAEVAVSNVLVQLLLVMVLVGIGFGIASATLVGQAMGRKDYEEAEDWGWRVGKIAVAVSICFAIPGALMPETLLSFFVSNKVTVMMGVLPFRVICIFIAFDIFGLVLLQSLHGAGDVKRVAIVAVSLQWFIGLPLCYLIGVKLKLGLLGVWGVHLGYRFVQTLLFAAMWKGGKWKEIKL